ncbi:MAG: transcription antitermination protein NusB [Candidatus Altimarinota bacterium]
MSHYSRSRTRKFLYQMLYASTFSKIEDETFKESFFSGVFNSELDESYLTSMFDLIIENQSFLIEVIGKYAPRFDIENMDLSAMVPMFIGSTEMLLFPEEIPAKVSINEAVEISKVYGDDSTRKMVNGVLNKVLNDLEKLKVEFDVFDKNTHTKAIFKK